MFKYLPRNNNPQLVTPKERYPSISEREKTFPAEKYLKWVRVALYTVHPYCYLVIIIDDRIAGTHS